jgi:predicted ATPase
LFRNLYQTTLFPDSTGVPPPQPASRNEKNDYNSFKLDRFRGISHADISGFKRINLFFGKNNCGKSSLPEAIFFDMRAVESAFAAEHKRFQGLQKNPKERYFT